MSQLQTLRVEQDVRDNLMILRLIGDADVANAPVLERAVDKVIVQRPAKVVLDLTALSFISSLSLGVLTQLATTLKRRDGRVLIVVPPGGVRDIMFRSRVIELFEEQPTVEAAIAAA